MEYLFLKFLHDPFRLLDWHLIAQLPPDIHQYFTQLLLVSFLTQQGSDFSNLFQHRLMLIFLRFVHVHGFGILLVEVAEEG